MQVHVQRALTVTVTAKHQQQSGLRVAETLSASSDESSQEPLPLTVRKPSAEANVGSESELRRAEDTHLTAKQHFWPSQGIYDKASSESSASTAGFPPDRQFLRGDIARGIQPF
ncbi:hypothetical protein LB505_001349 [Fusarium chuoi]|nr:hypothetical protein LB505_001349 [Fusarium chuoi]